MKKQIRVILVIVLAIIYAASAVACGGESHELAKSPADGSVKFGFDKNENSKMVAGGIAQDNGYLKQVHDHNDHEHTQANTNVIVRFWNIIKNLVM